MTAKELLDSKCILTYVNDSSLARVEKNILDIMQQYAYAMCQQQKRICAEKVAPEFEGRTILSDYDVNLIQTEIRESENATRLFRHGDKN